MPDLNEDMDQLFREAAGRYSLNTSGASWESVAKRLDQRAATADSASGRGRRISWLWLLFPIAFCLVLMGDEFVGSESADETDKEALSSVEGQGNPQRNNFSGAHGSGIADEVDTGNNTAGLTTGAPKSSSENLSDPEAHKNDGQRAITIEKGPAGLSRPRSATGVQQWPAGRPVIRHEDAASTRTNPAGPVQIQQGPRFASLMSIPLPDYTHAAQGRTPEWIGRPSEAFIGIGFQSQLAGPAIPGSRRLREKPLYMGVSASLDLSSVKWQHLDGPGMGAGLMVGYRLRPRLAIEAGLAWVEKKYYTDGRHFDRTQANLSPIVNILSFDGSCRMWEIPITLRYVSSRLKGGFTASAGLSSYLMQSEEYAYHASSGSWGYTGYRKYKRSGNHFLSTLVWTTGYQHTMGRTVRARIETYIKVPLSRMGVGNLLISSLGLNLGITRDL